MSVATALECDLEPFHKLHRVVLKNSASGSPAPTALSSSRNYTFDLPPPPSLLRVSPSLSDLRTSYLSMPEISTVSSTGEYTLSSNPPNPKTSFRLGDWICSSPNCAAHNFGRNLVCIGCGCPRSNNGNASGSQQQHQHQHQQPSNPSNARAQPSPRFNTMSNNVTYYSSAPPPSQNFQVQQHQHHHQQHHHQHHEQQQQLHHQQPQPQQHHQQQHLNVQQQHHTSIGYPQPQPPSPFGSSPSSVSHPQVANPPKSSHPLLTPSGRAFAIGGKVQNISSDPLSPCIMYWPDNEPFPEQGQIRPSNLAGVAQPPILNTGNRGPISHQPGDWICQKCNYLNWRRRKVCQTCLPYAEGNGDSISAAVQAERIALLTSVLSQTQLNNGTLNSPSAVNAHLNVHPAQPQASAPRSHSLTPPQVRRPFIDHSPTHGHAQAQTLSRSVHRSQSHYSLGQQFSAQAQQQLSPLLQQSMSSVAAATRPHYTASSPIYQTSGNPHRQPSPLYSTGPDLHRTSPTTNLNVNAHAQSNMNMNHLSVNGNHIFNANANTHVNVHAHAHAQSNATAGTANVNAHAYAHTSTSNNNLNLNSNETNETFTLPSVSVHAPAPLLPSFLQDIVQSPALSPTSTTTSSADLSSIEEYEDLNNVNSPQRSMFPRARGDSGSSDMHSPIANIWRLDGEESKSLSAFPLPNTQELAVAHGVRKTSREKLRI